MYLKQFKKDVLYGMSIRSGMKKVDATANGAADTAVTLKGIRTVGHQVGTLEGQKSRKGDFLYRPFTKVKSPHYGRILGIHFLSVTLCSMFIALTSLMAGAMFGPIAALSPPMIGIAAIQIGFVTYISYAVVYHLRVPGFMLPHTNPFITMAEMVHFQLGIVPALVQILAQVVGHAAAGGIMYGIIKSASGGSSFLDNTGIAATIVTTATSTGWAFFAQCIMSFFWTWYFFHNYNHRVRDVVFQNAKERVIYGNQADSRYLAQNLAMIKAVAVVVCYPIMGITLQNPLRWITGCVISGQCGLSGVWAVPVGPIVGVTLGYLAHTLTWSLTGPIGLSKYE